MKKLPLLEYNSNIQYFTIIVVTVVTVATVVTVVTVVKVVTKKTFFTNKLFFTTTTKSQTKESQTKFPKLNSTPDTFFTLGAECLIYQSGSSCAN